MDKKDQLAQPEQAPTNNGRYLTGYKAQPEQEPVFAFRRKGLDDFCTCSEDRYNELAQKPNLFDVKKFYTAPPQREWQGLTDEEIDELAEANLDFNWKDGVEDFARAIEAKLREKNT